MKTKSIQFSTVLIFVLANLLISSPIFAQVRTIKRKAGIEQIKKKEISNTRIKKASGSKELQNKSLYLLPTKSLIWSDDTHGRYTDTRDKKVYDVIKTGDQVWFAQNLDYETSNSWGSASNVNKYGRLYKWDVATTACPSGWHLPSEDEWKTLEMYLGMSQSEADDKGWRGTNEGKKLKSTSGWNSNGNGTDEVGFSALPCGFHSIDGGFDNLGSGGYWWSATEYSSTNAWNRYLWCDYNGVYRTNVFNKGHGFSVRCVRD
jgi:uncharacterized protein (TIGR02145 family)